MDSNWIPENIPQIIMDQRRYFASGATRSFEFRRTQLKKFRLVLQKYEKQVFDALKQDLGKGSFEAYVSEIRFVYREIDFALKRLPQWIKPKRVPSNLLHFPIKSYIYTEPYGVSLIISPWNYPLMLLFTPLVGAIAAGNCVVLKPSELTPATAKVMESIIRESFSPEYIAYIQGDAQTAQKLLEQRWDFIFFTGSTAVGRIVAQAAAKHLTPMILELGGKSPAIIDSEVDLESAATRIVWGKCFNVGQTCTAPDYLLVNRAIKTALVEKIKTRIHQFYGADVSKSPDYGRIVSSRHFDRLVKLMGSSHQILEGGQTDPQQKFIAPTLLGGVTRQDPVMQEEIFGPLLPVFEYDQLDEAIQWVNSGPKPLALYFFSNNKSKQQRVLKEVSSGGAIINDTLIHIDSHWLPFGGVGESGLGSYHGEMSYEAFSHKKSVVRRWFGLDLFLKFPPYRIPISWVKRLL